MSQDQPLESVTIVGTGLIGTSIALALRRHGSTVRLVDRDPAAVRVAVDRGAGLPAYSGHPVADLVVVAVPPGAVAAVLLDAQRRRLGRHYTDVASVKLDPLRRAAAIGCDLTSYVGGHPMAGGERSGPAHARADLFEGRTWVLCPTAESRPTESRPTESRPTESRRAGPLAACLALVRACGARPLLAEPAAHDRAVAVVSHLPHVVASAVAAALVGADTDTLRLAGTGFDSVTRVAAGDPALWTDILSANAEPVADALAALAAELCGVAAALRRGDNHVAEARATVADFLERGRTGRSLVAAAAAEAPAVSHDTPPVPSPNGVPA